MNNARDRRVWSPEANGNFLVKSLVTHLQPASPFEGRLQQALWKTKSPKRVNITSWIMLFGQLNCSSVLQKKLPLDTLSPSICPRCKPNEEELQHLFFECRYAEKCWFSLFDCFKVNWVVGKNFRDNVLQLLMGPKFKKKSKLLCPNVVKALLTNLWFERNQRVFHDKETPWIRCLESARLNASSWCSLSKAFVDYSIQEISLNWQALMSNDH